ncbi:hypothetical protein D9M72_369960 [compost metagenome]
MVYLREVGRLERHADAEFRQRVGQLDVGRVERVDRVRSFRLQPELHLVRIGEGAQQVLVDVGQRLEDAQHQRRHFVPDGQFDLRHAVADRQPRDQFAQRHQHRRDMRRQDFATRHVGDITALALMEPHQHAALLHHVAHGQARAVAVAPVRAGDRPEHHVRLDLGQVPQVVFQHALLDRKLRAGIQMLHRAPAADTEVLAARLHAHHRFLQDLAEVRLLVAGLAAIAAIADGLAGQRAFDEDDLARRAVLVHQAADAARFHIEAVDRHHGVGAGSIGIATATGLFCGGSGTRGGCLGRDGGGFLWGGHGLGHQIKPDVLFYESAIVCQPVRSMTEA